ncbi:hypothetical protein PG989_014930 [Apiospora arundinis]
MTQLCTNRPEGFGPMSRLSPHLPTQCFFDSVLAPMPTWIFLFSLPTMAVMSCWRRRGRANNYLYPRSSPYPFPIGSDGGGGGMSRRASNTQRRYPTTTDRQSVAARLKRLLPSLGYYGAIAVIILMQSVEIVQLERVSLGVGLLPFVYAGAAVAALLRFAEGLWGTSGHSFFRETLSPFWVASLFLWTGSAAVTATKTIALVTGLGLGGAPHSRDETAYPVVHQFVDLVILTAFYALAAAGEAGMTVLRYRERKAAARNNGRIEEDAVQLRESFANTVPTTSSTTTTNDK